MSIEVAKVLLIDEDAACLSRVETLLRTQLDMFVSVLSANSLNIATGIITQNSDIEVVICEFIQKEEDKDGLNALQTLRMFTKAPIVATVSKPMHRLSLIAEQAGVVEIVPTNSNDQSDQKLLRSVVSAIAGARRSTNGYKAVENKIQAVHGLVEDASKTQRQMLDRMNAEGELLKSHEKILNGTEKRKGLVAKVDERDSFCVKRSRRLDKIVWVSFTGVVTALSALLIKHIFSG